MNSGPVDHSKHPADSPAPPRSIWLVAARLGISFVILGSLWLFYPLVSIRICAGRIASCYESAIDSATGEITHYVLRPGTDSFKIRAWEEDLENRPIPRLLAFLPSRDPLGIWVVSQAIEQQLRKGKLVGWPGKREPVPPLDAAAAELILQVLDQDLPPPAVKSLATLLSLVPAVPEYKQILLQAIEHREPFARAFGVRILDHIDTDSDEALELVNKLANDSDLRVRATLCSFLTPSMQRTGTAEFQTTYQQVLVSALKDEAKEVRIAATAGIEFIDLESPDASEVILSFWDDSDASARLRVFSALSARMKSGHTDQLPSPIVDALFAGLTNLQYASRDDYLFKLIMLPNVPAERQWQFIEAELTKPDIRDSYYTVRLGLFSPTAPEDYRLPSDVDWKQFRERFLAYAAAAKPRLIEWATAAIKSDDESTAITGIQFLGTATPDEPNRLTPALYHPLGIVRTRALYALVPTGEQLPRILQLLNDPDADNPQAVRLAASNALSKCVGPISPEQIRQLVSAFRREQEYYPRSNIFKALQTLAPDGVDLDELALDSLTSDDAPNRQWAVRTLIDLGEKAHDALPQILDGIRSGRLGADAVEFVIAAGQPVEAAEDARQIIQLLLDATMQPTISAVPGSPAKLADRTPQWLRDVMKLCPSEFAHSVLPDELVARVGSADATSRGQIAKMFSVASIDPKVVVPKLREQLNSNRWEARHGAALAIAELGPKAIAAAELLMDRLADPEVRVRIAAADALGAIGPQAGAETAAALAQVAKQDKIAGVQMAAVVALGKMGPHTRAHLSTLESLTKEGDLMVRKAASRVVDQLKDAN